MSIILIAKKVKDGYAVEIIKNFKASTAEELSYLLRLTGLKFNEKLSTRNKLVATE
jgi:hypothetical protein